MGQFATVVVDPPWPVVALNYVRSRDYGPMPYPTMSLDAIASLPVGDVLADDAWLFIWATNRFLGDAIALLPAWGVTYAFTMAWVKPGGVQAPGGPQFNAEWAVVGRRGRPTFRDTRMFNTANSWPRRGHSEKPEGFYDLLRRVTLGPRLDVFGRRAIPGFTSWGDEAPEAPALPDCYQQVLAVDVG